MGVTFSTNSLQKMSGHNKFNKMAVYVAVTCGMIRDHPGMLRLVGLYCVPTDFCMGRKESERMDIMWEEEKCFAGQLSKKCLIHYFPFKAGAARRASSRHVTVLGPADSLTLAGRDLQRAGQWLVDRGHCERCVCMCVGRGGWGCALLESYIQLKPGPGFSLEMCTFERQEGGRGRAGRCFTLLVLHSV